MVRSLLGVGCVTTLLLLSGCGDDPETFDKDREDSGVIDDSDAGKRDSGPGEGKLDAGDGVDAGDGADAGADAAQPGEDGGDGIDFVTACLDEATSRDTRTEKLLLSGEGTSVGIVRFVDPDSFGTSGTTPWLPERFVVGRGTTAKCLTAPAQLTYESSHHNFDDRFSATEGDLTWIWKQKRVEYDVPTTWTVEARQGDQLLWGPVDLSLESCLVLNDSSACSGQYQ